MEHKAHIHHTVEEKRQIILKITKNLMDQLDIELKCPAEKIEVIILIAGSIKEGAEKAISSLILAKQANLKE